MTRQLELPRVARLLLDTREDILKGRTGEHLARVSEKGKEVDAGLTPDNILVITGSSNVQDYLFYNLRPWRPLPDMPEIDRLTSKDLPINAFHKGFLLHAARILRLLKDDRPEFIIGHSLGAAAAQILGTGLAVPTVCLAPPQVVKRKFLKPQALRSKEHPQWNVFNFAWKQDFVTHGFRWFGMRSLGHRVVVDSKKRNVGIDHFVTDYQDLIVAASASPTSGLPTSWPDPGFEPATRLV